MITGERPKQQNDSSSASQISDKPQEQADGAPPFLGSNHPTGQGPQAAQVVSPTSKTNNLSKFPQATPTLI